MEPKNAGRSTRYPELNYRQDAPGLWRVVATETGSSVGPQYHTRGELLADLDRYARESWGAVVSQPSPFPRAHPSGRVIVDERCSCPHPRSKHEPGGGGAFGHGPCSIAGCPCERFTWTAHVTKPAVTP